jgi:hypothetical protein
VQDEEGMAVCKHCGSTSQDLDRCEGCNRVFPADVKLIIKKKKLDMDCHPPTDDQRTFGGGKVTAGPSEAGDVSNGPTIEKRMFYGNKLKAQDFAGKMEEFSSEFDIKDTGSRVVRRSRPGLRGGRGRGPGRGRKSQEIGQIYNVNFSLHRNRSDLQCHPFTRTLSSKED